MTKERVKINGMADFDPRSLALLLCCGALLKYEPVEA
jgi:hypothetical protein